MAIQRFFVNEHARRAEIDEFLARELEGAGYSKVEMTKTPLGTGVVIYAAKPGLVIGRRGQSIRDLTKALEEKFHVENPQVSVASLENPDLDPKVVASQIATALERGVHFRRAAYWAIQKVNQAGALGVEIEIRGKLTTDRARYEKFRAGYLPKVGERISKQIRMARVHVQLKQGLFGVRVSLLPPNAEFDDRPTVKGVAEEPAPKLPVSETIAEPVAEAPAEPVEEAEIGKVEEVVEVSDSEKT